MQNKKAVRGLIVVSVLVLAGSCSHQKCYVDCAQGYEPAPTGCGCRLVQDDGGVDTAVDKTESGDSANATDAGFAADFSARARAALATAAPSWTCATSLPNVPVADAAAAREAVGQFIAHVVGVPVADIMVNVQLCNAATSPDCAVAFAHDTAKSGGSIYATADPLARELEANATSIEDTIWVPMQNGITLPGDAVMSGISDGMLVGMVVFNAPYACQ